MLPEFGILLSYEYENIWSASKVIGEIIASSVDYPALTLFGVKWICRSIMRGL